MLKSIIKVSLNTVCNTNNPFGTALVGIFRKSPARQSRLDWSRGEHQPGDVLTYATYVYVLL